MHETLAREDVFFRVQTEAGGFEAARSLAIFEEPWRRLRVFFFFLGGIAERLREMGERTTNFSPEQRTEQFKLVRRMKLLKSDLRQLNKNHFSGISGRVKQQSCIVENLQRSLLTQPDPVTASEDHREREQP
ncbi:hypothetical protein F2Q70_00040384 [Brassica cretica]|uniref:Uncharacterized protein n=2 Tax=Brassica cretica TaxID=69181 RepID=A0A3N6TIV7_BRACR|nr:hypothetical protein F2Q70_00040384 [Brassica cretica]KAF2620110.1 hypothetical protein F2Q68_00041051 [Brassica cretica]KAF3494160.1 hypothetical protein DY000_02055374 [Brassica cretica]